MNRNARISYQYWLVLLAITLFFPAAFVLAASEKTTETTPPAPGIHAPVGCLENPKQLRSLAITKPGVYENYRIDGKWLDHVLVRIKADGVTLRHCEIMNGLTNGVEVYAANTVIDSCRIHHMLKSTYKDQADAHGITGAPRHLVIRNCEIYLVSGDATQFDPSRQPWGDVLIEHCTFWTGPLPADAAGFKKGERPGENAVDTKQLAKNPRSKMTIRDCVFYGWNQPAQIQTMAALNLKNNVEIHVERCLFRDNEVCFRLRGPGKGDNKYSGAHVTIDDCAVYDSPNPVRIEDKIENLKINRLGFGPGIGRKYRNLGGGTGAGYENKSEYAAPAFEQLITKRP